MSEKNSYADNKFYVFLWIYVLKNRLFLYNKIVMMLREIMSTQCTIRALDPRLQVVLNLNEDLPAVVILSSAVFNVCENMFIWMSFRNLCSCMLSVFDLLVLWLNSEFAEPLVGSKFGIFCRTIIVTLWCDCDTVHFAWYLRELSKCLIDLYLAPYCYSVVIYICIIRQFTADSFLKGWKFHRKGG
jgi:hypothetical protein